MALKNANAVVMASVSDYGVASKEMRGVLAAQSAVPDALKPLQGAISRVAAKLGVDLNLSAEALNMAVNLAVDRRKNAPKVTASNDSGLTPI